MTTYCPPPTICACPEPDLVFRLSERVHIMCRNCGEASDRKSDLEQLVAHALGPRFVRAIDATNVARNRRDKPDYSGMGF